MRHRIMSILGAVISLFSSFFVIASVGDLFNPEEVETELSVIMGLFVFFSATAATGIYMFIGGRKKYLAGVHEKKERVILKKIAEKNGQLTPEEIAVDSDISLNEAREILNDMCSRGAGELRITGEGNQVYHFFGFVSKEEKKTAEGLLDQQFT